jgi:LPXTG-site transpeptidase (sortase) family protein
MLLKGRAARWRRHRFAVGITIVALGVCGVAVGVSLSAPVSGTRAVRTTTTAAAPKASASGANVLAVQKTVVRKQMPDPVRISIPAIGVNARVIALGLNSDDTMQVPTNYADTGWFQPGPEPGEVGPAIIVGHLNSKRGPAVFQRLSELRVGQVITVHLKGGSVVRFRADSMIRVAKDHFPTKRVYARTKQPTLRLVTCAGPFDPVTGHHADNYIVFASLVR